MYSIEIIILGILYAIILYSSPILIYRFLIKKMPVSKKKGIIIVILWALISGTIISFINYSVGYYSGPSNAIFFYSFINYFVLTKGYNKTSINNNNNIKVEKSNNNTSDKSGEVICNEVVNHFCTKMKCKTIEQTGLTLFETFALYKKALYIAPGNMEAIIMLQGFTDFLRENYGDLEVKKAFDFASAEMNKKLLNTSDSDNIFDEYLRYTIDQIALSYTSPPLANYMKSHNLQ